MIERTEPGGPGVGTRKNWKVYLVEEGDALERLFDIWRVGAMHFAEEGDALLLAHEHHPPLLVTTITIPRLTTLFRHVGLRAKRIRITTEVPIEYGPLIEY